MRFSFNKKNKKWNNEVDPDEIFLDSKNIPQFDKQQFEGRIEQPISKSTIVVLGLIFLFIGGSFVWRLSVLQIEKGEAYYNRSQQNTLNKIPIFGERGIIYDRNNTELAWNIESKTGEPFSDRAYIKENGFSHVLGYVGYPSKDKSGYYWQQDFIGKDGLEKQYDAVLKGTNGAKIFETDARGEVYSENIVDKPKSGENLTLSIDSRIQKKLFDIIKGTAESNSFMGGSGVVMDTETGGILALVNFPEYDSEILSLGDDSRAISGYLKDKRKAFLNRAVSGLYAPGSIIKPYVAIGALNEQLISPLKQILSTGSISIPNPYFPNQASVFKDWKAHGWTDMRRAIAVSSDVYFYAIGGGFQDQKGLGISNIDKYVTMFGLSQKTGIDLPGEVEGTIPGPEWKALNFPGDPWRIGDTYHTAIGQYGFQVTPIQMARAISSVANYGTLLKPHLVLNQDLTPADKIKLDIPKEYFDVIHEGMRAGVADGGTAAALNIPGVKIAAKTGTAQVGAHNEFVNSWVSGFFPYDNPRYAFVILMERGPVHYSTGGPAVARQLFDWMVVNTPEYLGS